MLRVGLDVQSVTLQSTGIGYYTRNLIREYNSIRGISFYYYRDSEKTELNTLEGMGWENLSLKSLAGKDRLDLLHIPGFAGPYLKGRFKKVTTVHDLIGIIYPRNLALASRFYWQRWLPACVKKSDFIIADSENTKKDIIRLLNIPAKKIKVVYLAADERFKPIDSSGQKRQRLNDYGIDRSYILNVGTIEPRKNIAGLIEAYAGYLKESKKNNLLLVIAGRKEWDYQRCFQKTEELALKDKVRFLDYVRDEDLPLLYNFAEVFVYPSFYEGFGLPVLEAMSCGTPVICSGTSSLPEVAGGCAIFIDPHSISSMQNGLEKALGDNGLRTELSRRAVVRAGEFSWHKTAAETIAAYREVLR